MPFDAATFTDKTTLYMERRQRAWDEVWSKVPQCVFDMDQWECGSYSCALGHLGLASHNGWYLTKPDSSGDRAPGWRRQFGFYAGASFFGLSYAQASACFGNTAVAKQMAKVAWFRSITPADVHRVLMSLPVTIPADA